MSKTALGMWYLYPQELKTFGLLETVSPLWFRDQLFTFTLHLCVLDSQEIAVVFSLIVLLCSSGNLAAGMTPLGSSGKMCAWAFVYFGFPVHSCHLM